jgi:hypothetical protein
MTVITDRGERLATPDDVPHLHRDAALLEVGHQHVSAGTDVHHHVDGAVAVGAGWVVGVAVGHPDDPPSAGAITGNPKPG